MNRSIPWLVTAAALLAAVAILAGGCGKKETPNALYVLEELEKASSVKDPAGKVERLKIFIANNAESSYRFLAYKRAYDALAKDLGDVPKAEAFLDEGLAKEKDPAARGELLLDRFDRLLETDKTAAIAYSDTLFAKERSPRLFLFMGYNLMDPKADPDKAVRCFLKSADLSTSPYAAGHAITMAGTVLLDQGKTDEAMRYFQGAAGDPEADWQLAKIYWKRANLDGAIDLYIRAAANMPSVREEARLDSLYAILHPGAKDLDKKILDIRIKYTEPMPGGSFVDLEGKAFDLSGLKGETKIVLYALSPT